jgi:hypothetical protein
MQSMTYFQRVSTLLTKGVGSSNLPRLEFAHRAAIPVKMSDLL